VAVELDSVPSVLDTLGGFRWLGDDEEGVGVIHWCASTFEEFAYLFWIENRIWHHLHDPDAGPLPSQLAEYLTHYPQPAA
jgi:hypothetical protein